MMLRRAIHRKAVCAPFLVAAVCGAIDTGRAQGDEPAYRQELEVALDPMPESGDSDPAPQLAEADAAAQDEIVGLQALVPDRDVDGARSARIFYGKRAPPGKWKSAVNIESVFVSGGQRVTSYCGGSLIDPRWVLTAAHCVFNEQLGGIRNLKAVTAHASDVGFGKGLRLHGKEVVVHGAYDPKWILNDIALVQLARPAAVPRQKLTADAGKSSFLAAGRAATIVGWGLTEQGKGASVLLEAPIPMAGRPTCDQFRGTVGFPKPGRPLGDASFCAGYGQVQRPITCNGDSGGPIFVGGGAGGEHIQAGIVSWGIAGCRGAYAAYANVGHFEAWIRKEVPNAVFVRPGATSSPVLQALQQIAGAEPDGPPSPHGQCSVDISVDGAAVNRVKVGAELTVHVTSGVSGHLAVFNRNAEDRRVQLFPNRLGRRGGPSPTAVRAGDVVSIPGPGDGFSLKVSPPQGRYEIVAVVVPQGVNLADIARPYEDMGRIADFEGVLARIADETGKVAASAARASRAVCTRQFEVVQ